MPVRRAVPSNSFHLSLRLAPIEGPDPVGNPIDIEDSDPVGTIPLNPFLCIFVCRPPLSTPMESYRFKNQGAVGTSSFPILPPPLLVPSEARSLRFGWFLRSRGIPFLLSYSCALFCTFLHSRKTQTLFFSSNSALLREKHPGGVTPSLHSSLRSSAARSLPRPGRGVSRYPSHRTISLSPAALLASLPASSTIAALPCGGE